jgi:hypothetical protein
MRQTLLFTVAQHLPLCTLSTHARFYVAIMQQLLLLLLLLLVLSLVLLLLCCFWALLMVLNLDCPCWSERCCC